MRHHFIAILTMLLTACAATFSSAFEIEDHAIFGDDKSEQRLRILSTADIEFFAPMISSYLSATPEIQIDYTVASSTEVMRAIYDEGASFDLVISSAMDLQTKLANDGYALTHVPSSLPSLPDWAVWNDMVFAFTQEPAAVVISKADFAGHPVPSTRQELIAALRRDPERFYGRIGTYDVRNSGLGYLFATQDARTSETYWRLTEVMGALDAQLYCCSSDMIDDVESGKLAIAYNVLGSYAAGRGETDRLETVLLSDFTTVMLRTVLIPRTTDQPELATAFIDHMLDRTYGNGPTPLQNASPDISITDAALHRIRLGPGLLVFLDQFKSRSFLSEWESAILQ
ncbi:MAG: ABC transporter substrate-binding protein [Marivivens sp.]|nr:ABC transporter substrate-binding protein [Marivivens sp.]